MKSSCEKGSEIKILGREEQKIQEELHIAHICVRGIPIN
jgi:hypothetical protein